MKKPLSDTHPEAEKVLIEGYRKMSASDKLQQVFAMQRMMYDLQMADVRRRYPDATEEECRLRVASRRLSADAMRKVFHWDPEKEGY
jgi:hypothetical protein